MASVGHALLALAFFAAAASAVTAVVWRHDDGRVTLARRGVYAVFFLLLACIVIIEVSFATNDFDFNIVAEHSSIETPMFYKLAAMWSSQEGSLLLWAFVLSTAASLALYSTRHKLRDIVPWATAVMMAIGAFFIGLMLFAPDVNPFHVLNPAPKDGIGLNPLLQHPSMMIHPPMLYSGYVAWTVPFAFAIGALITRRVDAEWIRATRRFALIAWTFLGFGLLLGARWSYSELGWGGYWAWDPVENAALMPFLLGTAFLHSIMVQEKRGMLKVWNSALIVATFSMCLLGTFLVRSGVLQSIHAFGNDTVGPYLLVVIGIVVIGSTLLLASRIDELRSPKRIDSLLSRESVFLVNNLLLVGMTVVIAWGTFFPLISELFTGQKSSLAAPWFDKYTTPLAILLVLFTGIGPLLAWRRVTWASARRVFRIPVAFAVLALVVLLAFTDAGNRPWALALFTFAAFAIAGILQEFYNGAHARQKTSGGNFLGALFAVTTRNRRRYGGYIVHIAIAILLIGIAASSSFQTNENVSMKPGETRVVDGREFTYMRPYVKVDSEKYTIGAIVRVSQDGKYLTTLETSRRFFRPTGAAATGLISDYFQGEATSEVGLQTGLIRDIWVTVAPNVQTIQHQLALADKGFKTCVAAGPGTPPQCKDINAMMRAAQANPKLAPKALETIEHLQLLSAEKIARQYATSNIAATFKVIINPLVLWMWIGGIIGLIGALIAVWPSRSRRKGAMVRTEADELKETKYSEIRDAELDHASGKLSDEDYAILDAELRKEAVAILDTVGVGAGTAAPRPGRAGLPSDWEGGEGNGNGANGHRNGTNGHATVEAPTDGNGTNGHATAEAPTNGNGHHPDDAPNGNGSSASHEPADRD
ncbi:MAG: cytochrome c-type biosis protein CcmF [Solirubrobacterales bacterium]|jgi:cytochrome c-type biogenesis protein CcmF|nr:cytochrome c-type biosis protein CcmF [Solirubrobacterales bacterium]